MTLVTASKSLMTLRNLVMYATPLEPPKTTNRNDTQPVIIRIGRPSPIDKLYLFRPTYCSTGCKDSHLRIARCLGDQTKPANSVGVLFQAKTGDARQNGWRVAPMRTFSLLEVVPEAGVEPARGVTAHDFESCRPRFSTRDDGTIGTSTSDSRGIYFCSETALSNESGTVLAPRLLLVSRSILAGPAPLTGQVLGVRTFSWTSSSIA